MMAYGREMLRKAGQGMKDFNVGEFLLDQDAKYARAAGPGDDKPFGQLTRGTSLRDAFSPAVSQEPEGMVENIMASALRIGVPTANIASRYALPAGGVTLAGAALHQLTGAFDEQTSGTLMPS